MSRLINADDLEIYRERFDTYDDYSMVFDMIDNAPTVDAEPVRHGKWIKQWYLANPKGKSRYYREACICSVCHEQKTLRPKYKYCPNCGAKMDEVNGDDK